MAPGSIFQFDASAAQNPASTAYRLQIGAAHNQLAARLNVNGTAANRCVIRSINLNGAANGYISDGGFLQGGMISAMFVDFTRVGSATTPAVSTANTGSSMFFLANAVFDGGGGIRTTYNIADGTIFSLRNVTWKNTISPTCGQINSPNPLTSGMREIVECVFDRRIDLYPPSALTIRGNFFNDAFGVLGRPWSTFEGNFIRHQGWGN
jgi:hypothetical protein